jgi:small-conductance mechanosensitive channel
MEFWNKLILPRLVEVQVIEWFTFTINVIVFAFSRFIASRYGAIKDEKHMRSRLRILHGFNLVVFLSFILSVVVSNESFPTENISLTCLTLLITYLLIHLAEALLLKRYGEELTVMGFTRRVETSTSATLELLAFGIILVSSVVVLINIWGFTGSLQTTGVIGFLALLMFTTKDYWMHDFLGGILLISSERLRRGDVVSIPAENVLGIVLEIRGRQTHVRDLVRGNDIMLPNSCLLKNRVDLYKANPGGSFKDFVDFKIGYSTASEKVHKFLEAVFEKVVESAKGMECETRPIISLKENEDHAARWRLAYSLKDPAQILNVRDAVNLAAYKLQDQFGLSVSTPTTHVVETRSGNSDKTSSKAAITGSESSS